MVSTRSLLSGIVAYSTAVKRPAAERNVSVHYNWMGGAIADESVSAVTLW